MKNKLLKTIIMLSKCFLYGLVLQTLLLNLVLAIDANGQYKNIEEVRVTLSGEEMTLNQFFKEVQRKTPFKFSYDNRDVDRQLELTFAKKEGPVIDFLREAAQQSELSFRQVNHGIDVMKRRGSAVEVVSFADPITVNGTVRDENGEPMPGATISVQGTNIGTVTDLDGKYSLDVQEGATLVFSYIGYKTQQVTVGNQTTINISLQQDESSLDEVVVVGYGSVQKSDLTGSVSSLRSKDFNPGANVSAEQMMQGRAAGVQINQASGEPGAGMRVRVRGSSSINAGNEPLYVIDGLPIDNSSLPSASSRISNPSPRNPLNALNPADIESIEILKDASATAIYGSRGANGVVMITTKKGKEGALQVDYSGYGGVQSQARRLDILNAQEYISVMNGIAELEGQSPVFTQSDIQEIGEGTDWQEEVFRQAAIQNHQLNFSGGTKDTKYYASLNYFNQDGILINSGMKRYTGRVNLDHQINNKFKFGINLTTSFIDDQVSPHGTGTNENAGVINAALEMDPTMPIFDAEGNYSRHPSITVDNPLAIANGISISRETNRTFGNVFMEYNIIEDLTARINFGTDRQTVRGDAYNSTLTIAGEGAQGEANVTSAELSNYVVELTSNYNKTFDEIHSLSILGGFTFQEFDQKVLGASARGFPSDATGTHNLGLGDNNLHLVNTNFETNTLLSYLGRINYNLKSKYLFTASFRADGSSRFGPENRFGYFPSFALGWRMNEESFMTDLSVVSELKLRGSWGITGNQEIGNFNFLQTYGLRGGTQGGAIIGNQLRTIVAAQRLPNPNLQWEETAQTNVGIDFGLFDGRITGTVDYFIKETDNLLLNLPIPSTSGFSSMLSNVGKVRNWGWEFLVNSENFVGPFRWSSSLNLSLINNEVVDLGTLPQIITGSGGGFISQISMIRPGEPMNSYFGHVIDGVFQQGDNIEGSAQPNAEPGYLRYTDQNGDGVIDSEDRRIIGDPFPDFTYGISNDFSYGNFNLSVFFQGVHGVEILNSNMVRTYHPISPRRNRYAEPMLNRWTPDNPSEVYPSGANMGIYATGGANVHTMNVEDASFLRLRNVRLSYNIPTTNISFLRSAAVYLSGQNLITFTRYSGFDPEVNSYGNSNVVIDYNSYPFPRIFMLGVNLGL